MNYSFAIDFPIKYVCSAWQLRKRGYTIAPDGTNVVRPGPRYNFVPIHEPILGPRGQQHVINPLYGIVENRTRLNTIIDADIARLFGVDQKIIRMFSDGCRNRMSFDRTSSEEYFAYNLGFFFRQRIYKMSAGIFSFKSLEEYSPLKFRDFSFKEDSCSWFD